MENTNTARPVEILLIEDNPGDIRLISEVLKDGKFLNTLTVARDGAEGIGLLRQKSAGAGGPLPDLILLDLNLPKKSGREVLAEIKKDDTLKHLPVVILTGSKAEEDVFKAYQLQGNCYITKPVDVEKFINVIREIENFWLNIVRLPGPADGARQ